MIKNQLTKKDIPYKHWEYKDVNTGNRLRIVPERGGLITEWLCNGKNILYFDLDRFQLSDKSIRGGIPILFPICGDLQGGSYSLFNTNYKLNQHGFARDIPWKIQALDKKNAISLTLLASPNTLNSFPFQFFIDMQVKLGINSLEINLFINNSSEDRMPFSLGLHPYFQVSMLNNIAIRGLSDTCINHLNMTKDLTRNQLKNLKYGIDFLTTSKDKGLVELIDLDNFESIHMYAKKPMDLVVAWTDPPRKMVCLEPWTSPRNSLNSGDRTLFLDPGETKELCCKFVFNKLNRPYK